MKTLITVFVIATLLAFPKIGFGQETSTNVVPKGSVISPKQVFQIESQNFLYWDQLELDLIRDRSGRYLYTALEKIAPNELAILGSFQEGNQIRIYSLSGNECQLTKRIALDLLPLDFIHQDSNYYVLGEDRVVQLSSQGEQIESWALPQEVQFVQRLEVIDDKIALLTPSGYSYVQEGEGFEKLMGWSQAGGQAIDVVKSSNSSFQITGMDQGKRAWKTDFKLEDELGAMILLGRSTDYLFFTLERIGQGKAATLSSELIAVRLEEGIMTEEFYSIPLPNANFVFPKNGIRTNRNGIVVSVPTQEGLFLFNYQAHREEGDFDWELGPKLKGQTYLPSESVPGHNEMEKEEQR